jgi:hypothetical protein
MTDPDGRFVVLNFPICSLPMQDQHLNVYRRGKKVGEVKITGPKRDDNIVAEILDGVPCVGDVVRD